MKKIVAIHETASSTPLEADDIPPLASVDKF
jgi:hypothetical protein